MGLLRHWKSRLVSGHVLVGLRRHYAIELSKRIIDIESQIGVEIYGQFNWVSKFSMPGNHSRPISYR